MSEKRTYTMLGLAAAAAAATFAISMMSQNILADNGQGIPPFGDSGSTGYQHGTSRPCNFAPPSNSDGEQPGNTEVNPVFRYCD
jgi:hypothetical protein